MLRDQNIQPTYYPFGMLMKERAYTSNSYRFGFNGQEKDYEVSGSGNSLDFGARIYDSRLCRFMSLDPKKAQFPWMSPYLYAANNPILFIDEYGMGPIDALETITKAADSYMNKAWKESFNSDKTVVNEVGFIVAARTVKFIKAHDPYERTDYKVKNYQKSKSGGSISIDNKVDKGEKYVGKVHTHPYSKSEGSHTGVAFSAADISNIRVGGIKKDFVQMVEAGTQRFGLVVIDEKKAADFFKNNTQADLQKTYDDAYNNAKGTFQERVKEAVKATTKDSGLEFYETTDKKKKKWSKVK